MGSLIKVVGKDKLRKVTEFKPGQMVQNIKEIG
jgi:hypothetical protein